MKKIALLFLALMMLTSCASAKLYNKNAVKPESEVCLKQENTATVLGIDRIDEEAVAALLKDKKIGVFTNQSGINSKLECSVDVLCEKFDVKGIYVPEHGLFGAVVAGEKFNNAQYNGVTVYSLYGETRRPTEEMLRDIDVLVVDIQDVGVRHYTYTSSVAYVMEECAKYNKKVVILDRPNPLGGAVEGPVLKPEYSSFIGLYELPLRHGLTMGEFARFINSEKNINCPLEIVAMKNWHRNMYWQDTKLPWVQTSPLIPTAETALLYNVTGISGDMGISNGVGTAKPFYFVGATYADAHTLKKALEALNIPGVGFRVAVYAPRYGNTTGAEVHGLEIYLLEPRKVNLSELGYLINYTFQELYPEQTKKLPQRYGGLGVKINIALGEDSLAKHEKPELTFERWQRECKEFSERVKPYLLY